MLAAMDTGTKRVVYVRLLDEGTHVYRPAVGIFLGNDVYQLEELPGYDLIDECWEFPPGSSVRCEERMMFDGPLFVASALAYSGKTAK